MVISRKHRCVFVHVPKTGGQSVEHVFLRSHGLDWKTRAPLLLRKNPDPSLGPPSLAHLTAAEYVGCGHLSPEEFDAFFVFAFVRNPWSRLVSEWRYRYQSRGIDFRSFVLEAFPEPSWSDASTHVMAQHDFLYDDTGRCLVDFVGRYERLQEDFATVAARVGLESADLPHVNRSADRGRRKGRGTKTTAAPALPYPAYYDDETREAVAARYAVDIATFAYEFDR